MNREEKLKQQNKLMFFDHYLLDICYCSLGIFLENYGKGIETLKQEIKNCETEKEIKALVNSYI